MDRLIATCSGCGARQQYFVRRGASPFLEACGRCGGRAWHTEIVERDDEDDE